MPIAWQLYLPEICLDDAEQRHEAKIPDEIIFQTKRQIAIAQVRIALAAQMLVGIVLADSGYDAEGQSRQELTDLGPTYSVAVQPIVSLWRPGEGPLPPKTWSGKRRPPKLVQRSKDHKPFSAKGLAQSLSVDMWKTIAWRQGTNVELVSRFAAVRIRVASRDYNFTQTRVEEWFLVEWPEEDHEPPQVLSLNTARNNHLRGSGCRDENTVAHRARLLRP